MSEPDDALPPDDEYDSADEETLFDTYRPSSYGPRAKKDLWLESEEAEGRIAKVKHCPDEARTYDHNVPFWGQLAVPARYRPSWEHFIRYVKFGIFAIADSVYVYVFFVIGHVTGH